MIRQLSAFVSVIVRKAAAPSAGGPRQFMTDVVYKVADEGRVGLYRFL
jgi:hypothetical protein